MNMNNTVSFTLSSRSVETERPATFDEAALNWLWKESAKSNFFNLVFQGTQLLKDRATKSGRACRDLQECNDHSELLGMIVFADDTRIAESTADAICLAAFKAFMANRRNDDVDDNETEAELRDTQFWTYQALMVRESSMNSPDYDRLQAPVLYWECVGADKFKPHREIGEAITAAEEAAANWKMEQQRLETVASNKRRSILEQMRNK